jgi:polyhydroxybutyrate depolymerase
MTRSSLRRSLAAVAAATALFGGVLNALAPSPADATATATCSLTSTGGTVTKTVWVGVEARSYNLHVPAGLTAASPLLIDLHGLGSNAFFQEQTSGWSPYADAKKFIVAYPAGSSWGQAWDFSEGSSDVTFLRAVVKDIKAQYCVDAARVFAEGGSLGGYMSQRLACDAEDVFASFVSTISGPLDASPCSLSRPVSAGIVNVENDPLFPTANSIKARDLWLNRDGCTSASTPDPNAYGANGAVYSNCSAGAAVLWRTYTGSSHAYPTGAALDDLHNKAWNFLMAHPYS